MSTKCYSCKERAEERQRTVFEGQHKGEVRRVIKAKDWRYAAKAM